MAWKIRWSAVARKQIKKIDKKRQVDILHYLNQRVNKAKHPYDFGKPLRYQKYGLWCYRVADVRVICQIKEQELVILVLSVGHRKDIYNH